ncbi:MAG: GNAT family N-acetyltransferase [Theionarchaea archaeon]|nr:GNAT family N-acetyltransferase [Theionarchaea archaeon]
MKKISEDLEIELRDATCKNFDFLYTLHRATLKEYVEKTWGWDEAFQKEHFMQHFNPDIQQIIVAANIDIGSISVIHENSNVFLRIIEILPAYQDRGIGTFLIEEILIRARSENKSVLLQVLKVNRRARALYEQMGFSISGETETHYQMKYCL